MLNILGMFASDSNKSHVLFLGTGTSQGIPVIGCSCQVCLSDDPRDKRLRTSLLVQTNLTTIVIDAGPDFRQQMLTYKVKQLDSVLLTHAHHDHIGGLDDVRAYNFLRKKPMNVYGTSACLEILQTYYRYAFDENKYPGVPEFRLQIVEPYKQFQINDIYFIPLLVYHGKIPIIGYKFQKFAYITDANSLPQETKKYLQNLDVLIINALRHEPHHSHFHFEAVFELIKQIGPKVTYLTHLSHTAGLYKVLSENLPANVFLSYDGLSLII